MTKARAERARIIFLAAACALLVGLLVTGCDDQVERQIGDLTARSVEREFRVVDDPLAVQWVNHVGHTLVAGSLRQNLPYEFKIVDTDMVNAFAAPYGHVYVTTGLLDFAESEDELWGVMGHEVGHVVHRHSLTAVKRGFMYDLGMMVVGVTRRSENTTDVAGVGLGLLALHYSRGNEYEADDMGRELSYTAGYDPRGNLRFFQRLKAKYEKGKPSRINAMFATHPPTDNRIARQIQFPELSDQSAEALLQTGRGFARRYQLRQAEASLSRAVALAPQSQPALLSLAEVQLQRGEFSPAAASFQRAQKLGPSRFAEEGRRLAALGDPPAPVASAQERAAALALTPEAVATARQAEEAVREAQHKAGDLTAALAPTVAGTHQILDNLDGLAETRPRLAGTTEGIVVFANSAVNQALDPVYSTERQRDGLLATAQETAVAARGIAEKLAAAGQGRAAPGDVGVLGRSLREARRAVDDLRDGLRELAAAQPAVTAAQRAAADTTKQVERLMHGDRNPRTPEIAAQNAQLTESRALSALAATGKSKKTAERAALRTLVARMNLAGVGATPRQRAALDSLVATALLQRSQLVGELRGTGLGYGDVALVLTTAPAMKTDPRELAKSAAGGSMVDQVSGPSTAPGGARFLLKYLAWTLEGEAKA